MSLVQVLYVALEGPIGGNGAMIVYLGLLCLAFFVGLMIGWASKPKLTFPLSKALDFSSPSLPYGSPLKQSSAPFLDLFKNSNSCTSGGAVHKGPELTASDYVDCSAFQREDKNPDDVTEEDLHHLYHLVEMKDGGPPWIHMLERSTERVTFQAWRRDPKVGPTRYRTRTVFEDATPEIVRDFFWDDDFRSQWDDMLAHHSIIDECTSTGAMIVHWIRRVKFPFFCSDREYIIGRRIWESGNSYYCVTKGVCCSSIPRREKLRRVNQYYSSWCIRAVEARDTCVRSACEVILFHHEDTGIPREIAKLGVKQGMWGAVKKMEHGLRAYQQARASGVPVPLSRHAYMARVNTKLRLEFYLCRVKEETERTNVTTLPQRSFRNFLQLRGRKSSDSTQDMKSKGASPYPSPQRGVSPGPQPQPQHVRGVSPQPQPVRGTSPQPPSMRGASQPQSERELVGEASPQSQLQLVRGASP